LPFGTKSIPKSTALRDWNPTLEKNWTELDNWFRIWLRGTANWKIGSGSSYILILSRMCAKSRKPAKCQKQLKEGSIPSILSILIESGAFFCGDHFEFVSIRLIRSLPRGSP
jgi:hypothetical protein